MFSHIVLYLGATTVTVHSTLPRHLPADAHNSLGSSSARVSRQARWLAGGRAWQWATYSWEICRRTKTHVSIVRDNIESEHHLPSEVSIINIVCAMCMCMWSQIRNVVFTFLFTHPSVLRCFISSRTRCFAGIRVFPVSVFWMNNDQHMCCYRTDFVSPHLIWKHM